jgi:catechol 2,3-dioxygenase-like lactoylglutathione lyase family enzyme
MAMRKTASRARKTGAVASPKARASRTKAKKEAARPARAAAAKKAPARRAAKAKPSKPPARRATASAVRKTERRKQPEALRLRDLTVSLTVDNLERSLRFYTETLGFTVKDRWETDGVLRGVELVAGSCGIGLSQDNWAKGRDRTKGVGMRIWAGTKQDLEALARRIRAGGGEADGPKTEPWGAHTLSVADPDGFRLTIQRAD